MPPLGPVTWDVSQPTFNRMYRERRLAAAANGLPFPSYRQAFHQLGEAMAAARVAGEVADVNAFWDCVFRPQARDRERVEEVRQGRKAAARHRMQAVAGSAAENAARAATGRPSLDVSSVAAYVDPFFAPQK